MIQQPQKTLTPQEFDILADSVLVEGLQRGIHPVNLCLGLIKRGLLLFNVRRETYEITEEGKEKLLGG